MNEYKSIKQYLKDLKHALKGLDPALIADALDDAEEHLELAVEEYVRSENSSTQEALKVAFEKYGSPSDIAEEYRRLESEKEKKVMATKKRSLFYQIFGIYFEPKTYFNLTYLLLQFPLGIIYFTYLVVAALVVAVLVIMVVGIPLGILFLFSIFALSWFHGRVSEAFLGIRMPRRKRKLITSGTTWQKMKSILKDLRLYTSALYLVLTLPLGIIYFVGLVALFSAAVTLIASPITDILSLPVVMELFEGTWGRFGLAWFGTTTYTIVYPVLGFILLTGILHLFNAVAGLHGRMTKLLLVKR